MHGETQTWKNESQMGFEPTTLHDLARCSDHRATGDSMVSTGQLLDLDYEAVFISKLTCQLSSFFVHKQRQLCTKNDNNFA